MAFLAQELIEIDDNEHGCEHKTQAFCVKGDEGAKEPPESCPRDPVDLVEQGHEKVEPAPVHALGNAGRVVDGKGLVAQPEHEIGLLHPHATVLLKHGKAIEEMAGVHHERQPQGLQGREGPKQQVHGHKFHGAGKDSGANEHGIPEAEARGVHVDAIVDVLPRLKAEDSLQQQSC